MALFSFHVDQIKRSNGSSVVAAAAYRAGERLHIDRYDEVSDYTKKRGVLHKEIMLPENAPEEYKDRETLWNSVEDVEKRADAQLAYSFMFTLQNEFSFEENLELARKFIQEHLVAKGMIADFVIHEKEVEKDGQPNPHVHVLCPMRPLNEDGSWGSKQKSVLVLDENGNNIWDEKNKRWKVDSIPQTDWGDRKTLELWRKAWCDLCNAKFEEKGMDIRIDHRSYERQGLELLPQIHEGPSVRAMEKKGIATEKGEYNRWVRRHNAAIKALAKKLRELGEWIKSEKPKLELLNEPSVKQFLLKYMDMQNKGAESFSAFGRQKANGKTLKTVSEMIVYLDKQGIDTADQLENRISVLTSDCNALKGSLNAKKSRSNELKELLRLAKVYKENQPIYEEWTGIRFKKRKDAYREVHRSELDYYQYAKRKLAEAGMEKGYDSELVKKWKSESSRLANSYEADYARFCTIREEKNAVSHIRYCVDRVIAGKTKEITKTRENKIEI